MVRLVKYDNKTDIMMCISEAEFRAGIILPQYGITRNFVEVFTGDIRPESSSLYLSQSYKLIEDLHFHYRFSDYLPIEDLGICFTDIMYN